MRSRLFFIFKLFLVWLLFFALLRLAFLAWQWRLLPEGISLSEVFASFLKGLPLDGSMIGYLIAIPVLLTIFGAFFPLEWRHKFNRTIHVVNMILFGICLLIGMSNIVLYSEWQTMLNQRALDYLKNPAGLVDSLGISLLTGMLLGIAALLFGWSAIYRRCIKKTPTERTGWLSILCLSLGLLPALGVMIRGGLGPMPINESVAYYSKHTMLNHAATNPVWHLMHTLIERRSVTNHFIAFDQNKAKELVEPLLRPMQIEARSIGQMPKPNIVVVMMESMTAQVVATFGGEKGISKCLDSIAADALVFDQVYSTGYRTDQGLTALLSGYPSQPDQSVILLDDKMSALASLPRVFHQNGYRTLYVHGGELNFANMGAYLHTLQFDRILSESDFSRRLMRQNWGVPDHLVFERAIEELNKEQAPFFGFIQTLSLHLPYDVPFEDLPAQAAVGDKFRRAARYADHSIGLFLEAASSQPWFQNTIFVFVADHGHGEPGALGSDIPMARKVPLLFYGHGLHVSLKGTRMHHLGNHHDLPRTLIEGLQLANDSSTLKGFKWSRNLLVERPEAFATYCNETGMGWINAKGCGYFRFTDQAWSTPQPPMLDSTGQMQARAYLQVLYDDFLQLGNKK